MCGCIIAVSHVVLGLVLTARQILSAQDDCTCYNLGPANPLQVNIEVRNCVEGHRINIYSCGDYTTKVVPCG